MSQHLSLSFDGIYQIDTTAHSFAETFLKEKLAAFQRIVENPKTGFIKVTERIELRDSCRKVFQKFKTKKNFFHIGIGGSSLGPEMLVSALKKSDTYFKFINNIDPDQLAKQIKDIKLEETLFYFVSKSGTTAETTANLAIVMNLLKKEGYREDQFKNFFVFATNPTESQLLDLSQAWDIETLEIPNNIGGRFSVLTPVGFLPALFANIDIDQLCQGAEEIKKEMLTKTHLCNPLLRGASTIFELWKQKGIDQTVLMPYSSRLKNLSFWFVQLWAESLGKKYDREGLLTQTGLTPISAYGPTDQHSQVQLFMEGPKNKCLFVLQIENFDTDFSLSNSGQTNSLKKLSPFTLSQLLTAELQGTLKALQEADRPYIHLKIPRLSEKSLGALIFYFEGLTAIMGEYFNIDPFNQPGVEAGKKYAFEFLEKIN